MIKKGKKHLQVSHCNKTIEHFFLRVRINISTMSIIYKFCIRLKNKIHVEPLKHTLHQDNMSVY